MSTRIIDVQTTEYEFDSDTAWNDFHRQFAPYDNDRVTSKTFQEWLEGSVEVVTNCPCTSSAYCSHYVYADDLNTKLDMKIVITVKRSTLYLKKVHR